MYVKHELYKIIYLMLKIVNMTNIDSMYSLIGQTLRSWKYFFSKKNCTDFKEFTYLLKFLEKNKWF